MDTIILKEWLSQFGDQLKPPVANKVLLENEQILVMAVGGPNNRSDYHYNETSEFFYQIEGTLKLFLQKNGKKHLELVGPGSLFLLDARIPHSPVREANSLGLVIEFKRNSTQKDGLQWYCSNCNTLLFEEYFQLNDIEKDFPVVFSKFFNDLKARTCTNCATIHPKG